MGRRFLVAISLFCSTFASVWAPFAHIHPADPGHHHGNGFAHPHFARAHESHHLANTEGPELEDRDRDEAAVWTEWAPTIPPRCEVLVSEVAVSVIAKPLLVPVGLPSQHTVRSHDPPGDRLYPPRSPPV